MHSSSLLLPCAVLVLAATAAAETLKVPADFATIGGALAVAADGDTVTVSKGLYLEVLDVTAPNVKLLGKKAVIDAQYAGDCITVHAENVTIAGFTLLNGLNGVQGLSSGLTVTKCTVLSCSSRGINVQDADATITSNTVIGCSNDGINFSLALSGKTLIDKNVCRMNGQDGIVANGNAVQVTRNRCERNESDGIQVVIDFPVVDGDLPQATISQNDCNGNDNNGINVTSLTSAPIVLHDNDCLENASSGLLFNARNGDIQGNRCDDNMDDGLNLSIDHTLLVGNSASRNQNNGILIQGLPPVADGTIATGDLNVVEKNSCNDNARDGIVLLFGNSNSFKLNKCSGNGDDGIDIESVECTSNAVESNNLGNNLHEGLDNGGTGTDVIKNTCKGNGAGLGPDIAGTGDQGLGSVDAFQDNKFDTGGESETARLDNFENTTP